jgi:hypothetical protein
MWSWKQLENMTFLAGWLWCRKQLEKMSEKMFVLFATFKLCGEFQLNYVYRMILWSPHAMICIDWLSSLQLSFSFVSSPSTVMKTLSDFPWHMANVAEHFCV